jgi:hypothetical protein
MSDEYASSSEDETPLLRTAVVDSPSRQGGGTAASADVSMVSSSRQSTSFADDSEEIMEIRDHDAVPPPLSAKPSASALDPATVVAETGSSHKKKKKKKKSRRTSDSDGVETMDAAEEDSTDKKKKKKKKSRRTSDSDGVETMDAAEEDSTDNLVSQWGKTSSIGLTAVTAANNNKCDAPVSKESAQLVGSAEEGVNELSIASAAAAALEERRLPSSLPDVVQKKKEKKKRVKVELPQWGIKTPVIPAEPSSQEMPPASGGSAPGGSAPGGSASGSGAPAVARSGGKKTTKRLHLPDEGVTFAGMKKRKIGGDRQEDEEYRHRELCFEQIMSKRFTSDLMPRHIETYFEVLERELKVVRCLMVKKDGSPFEDHEFPRPSEVVWIAAAVALRLQKEYELGESVAVAENTSKPSKKKSSKKEGESSARVVVKEEDEEWVEDTRWQTRGLTEYTPVGGWQVAQRHPRVELEVHPSQHMSDVRIHPFWRAQSREVIDLSDWSDELYLRFTPEVREPETDSHWCYEVARRSRLRMRMSNGAKSNNEVLIQTSRWAPGGVDCTGTPVYWSKYLPEMELAHRQCRYMSVPFPSLVIAPEHVVAGPDDPQKKSKVAKMWAADAKYTHRKALVFVEALQEFHISQFYTKVGTAPKDAEARRNQARRCHNCGVVFPQGTLPSFLLYHSLWVEQREVMNIPY